MNRSVLRLHQRVQALGSLELADARLTPELADTELAIDRIVYDTKLVARCAAVLDPKRDVLRRGDLLPKIAELVHPRHAIHQQRVGAHRMARDEPGVIEAVQEEERAVTDRHCREHDCFDLTRNVSVDLILFEYAEFNRGLAETLAALGDLGDLL